MYSILNHFSIILAMIFASVLVKVMVGLFEEPLSPFSFKRGKIIPKFFLLVFFNKMSFNFEQLLPNISYIILFVFLYYRLLFFAYLRTFVVASKNIFFLSLYFICCLLSLRLITADILHFRC